MGTRHAKPGTHNEGPAMPKVAPGCKNVGIRQLPSLLALPSQEGRSEMPTLQ